MDIRNYGLLHRLLGQTITSLSWIVVDQMDYNTLIDQDQNVFIENYVVPDKLVFALANGKRFELLCNQFIVLFEDVSPGIHAPFLKEQSDDFRFTQIRKTFPNLSDDQLQTKQVAMRNEDNKLLVFASFEIEPEEKVLPVDLPQTQVSLPFTVASITEIWAAVNVVGQWEDLTSTERWVGRSGYREPSYLVAIILWDSNRSVCLSLCTETDEIELLSVSNLHRRLDDIAFYAGTLLHRWYSE